MPLSVPERIWSTTPNLDIHSEREGGQYLGHFNPGDGPLEVVNHYYYPDDNTPADCYFKVKLLAPVTVNGVEYLLGWVIGCDSYAWKVRFTEPAPVTPPPATVTNEMILARLNELGARVDALAVHLGLP